MEISTEEFNSLSDEKAEVLLKVAKKRSKPTRKKARRKLSVNGDLPLSADVSVETTTHNGEEYLHFSADGARQPRKSGYPREEVEKSVALFKSGQVCERPNAKTKLPYAEVTPNGRVNLALAYFAAKAGVIDADADEIAALAPQEEEATATTE